LRKIIPSEFGDTAVQTKAVLVLEAFINLIGQQLTYLKTFGAKAGISWTNYQHRLTIGRISKSLVTDTHNFYEDAGVQLQRSLENFNQALLDVELRIGIGLLFSLADG